MFSIAGQAHGRCNHWNEVRLSNFNVEETVFLWHVEQIEKMRTCKHMHA